MAPAKVDCDSETPREATDPEALDVNDDIVDEIIEMTLP